MAFEEPSHAICTRAADTGADLIAIGTRGLTGLGHVMPGSTAERVIRRSGAAVASSKDPGEDGAR